MPVEVQVQSFPVPDVQQGKWHDVDRNKKIDCLVAGRHDEVVCRGIRFLANLVHKVHVSPNDHDRVEIPELVHEHAERCLPTDSLLRQGPLAEFQEEPQAPDAGNIAIFQSLAVLARRKMAIIDDFHPGCVQVDTECASFWLGQLKLEF
eukprot:CAMPEP_0115740926 /NCGR_PEP_ID=MMETSP0272-20121206/89737_1 /TAXON_ID=71861 /ORGANISM="Scrippsiella trochoidea, Strain CCMP3099" /LENGTH=148 /DNA_ID=CAMNT_0003185579 /DNA_START=75 /DNA_END=521 /DNA_ORIENTATION=+